MKNLLKIHRDNEIIEPIEYTNVSLLDFSQKGSNYGQIFMQNWSDSNHIYTASYNAVVDIVMMILLLVDIETIRNLTAFGSPLLFS